jgi:hypothetical protein
MACNSLGFFSTGSTPNNLCDGPFDVELFGYDLSVGEQLFSDSMCSQDLGEFYASNSLILLYYDRVIISITQCDEKNYCIQNTNLFDGSYNFAGTHNNFNYYTGETGVIFYSNTELRWCLSDELDNPCIQFGPYLSSNMEPDLDETVMYTGLCITTTTTTNPCSDFDYEAIFECLVPLTPTPTPTSTPTPTPTPTPTSSNLCGGVSMVVSFSGITPTPTPTNTPTPSPSPEITRPCNYSGEVTFNTFSEVINCANSKKFKDCFTGVDYYTSDLVLVSGTTQPKEGYVYNATINGQGYCVIYDGLFENVSGVDTVILTNEIGPSSNGSCLLCSPNLTSTPTPTPTSTPTPTPSSSPCVSYQYGLTNLIPSDIILTYVDCGLTKNILLERNTSTIICASVPPTQTRNIQVYPLNLPCS